MTSSFLQPGSDPEIVPMSTTPLQSILPEIDLQNANVTVSYI